MIFNVIFILTFKKAFSDQKGVNTQNKHYFRGDNRMIPKYISKKFLIF